MNREQAEAVVDALEAAVSEGNDRLRDAMRRLVLSVMCEERSYPVTVTAPVVSHERAEHDNPFNVVTRPLSERGCDEVR